jgi:hypothetical protein
LQHAVAPRYWTRQARGRARETSFDPLTCSTVRVTVSETGVETIAGGGATSLTVHAVGRGEVNCGDDGAGDSTTIDEGAPVPVAR